MKISEQEQDQLLALARDSIAYGLKYGRAIEPASSEYDDNLKQTAACFVTLTASATCPPSNRYLKMLLRMPIPRPFVIHAFLNCAKMNLNASTLKFPY